MRIGFRGNLTDEKEIKAGFIGCGSHSFRNIYPTFQFAPVKLVATCDLSHEKAEAFAEKFGAEKAYSDYKVMLENEQLDAVFIVTGYDKAERPLYPQIAIDCLNAGCHVWMEKPAAATCEEIEKMQEAEKRNGKKVMVGYKKMFFPANEKAKELMTQEDFGRASLILTQYPLYIPDADCFERYLKYCEPAKGVASFLDHICHPVSLILHLAGMPSGFSYERSNSGAGVINFTYESGLLVSLALTHGSSLNGGMERTTIISDKGKHITIDNNIRLSYHQSPPDLEYGKSPNFYTGNIGQTTAYWEPEFSLGNLYNKGLFILGYYNEIAEFAKSIIEDRPVAKSGLEHAWQITRIFELFTEGPGKKIKC